MLTLIGVTLTEGKVYPQIGLKATLLLHVPTPATKFSHSDALVIHIA
jgi:hypothetical protein